MGPVDHLTSAEITSAIRYLDPEAGKRNGNNAGATLWPFLIVLGGVLAGALVYIWLYLRTA